MKTPFSILLLRRHLAAVAVSLGFLGLSAHAAPIAAPATAPGVAGAPAGNTLPVAAPEEDIFDIRPPIHIADEVFWAGWGAGALAAAGLGYGVWRLLRGKLRVKLPYEVALEKLLAARQFLSPEQAQHLLGPGLGGRALLHRANVPGTRRTSNDRGVSLRSCRQRRQPARRAPRHPRRISRPLRSREVRDVAAQRPADGSDAAKRPRLHPRHGTARESAASRNPGSRVPTGGHPSLTTHPP